VQAIDATQIGADRGMLGELFAIDVTYATDQAGPPQVVAKFAALRDGALASARRGGAHERELRCYGELLAETPVAAPKLFGAWYDPETAHFLLLQSLIEVDTDVDQVAGITLAQARSVLAQVAQLHAHWWDDPRLAEATWLPRLDASTRLRNLTHLAERGWPLLAAMLDDDLTPTERSFGAGLTERLPEALRSLAALPATLLHCDLRADNLLFSPTDGEVTLVDWQGAGIGPPAFDLAYFLVQSLTVDDRRSHERALIESYRVELARAGRELTFDQIMAGYGDALNYGLVIACAIPIISDPSEPRVRSLATTMARRSVAALHDHQKDHP